MADGWPRHLERRRLAYQRRARSTIDVIDPELRRAAEPAGLRCDDVLPVGRELGRRVQVVIALRDLDRVLLVEGQSPEIVAAAQVGYEDDLLPIGAESRLVVHRHAAR